MPFPEKTEEAMKQTVEKVIQCMLAMQRYPWEQGVCAQALFEAGQDHLWIPMAHAWREKLSEKTGSEASP